MPSLFLSVIAKPCRGCDNLIIIMYPEVGATRRGRPDLLSGILIPHRSESYLFLVILQ